jgi:prophage regulatory protein
MSRRIIRRAELQRRVPFSMVHIWRLERQGKFPTRIKLGENSVGWDEDEIDAWIEARIRAGGRSPQRSAASPVG